MEWDGIKIEEKKMRDSKCENPKSRGNYTLNTCTKFHCTNRDKKCGDCIRYSLLNYTKSK